MAIGTSDGGFYDTETDFLLSKFDPTSMGKSDGMNNSYVQKVAEDRYQDTSYHQINEPKSSPADPTHQTFFEKLKTTWPAKAVEGLMDAFKLPGQVYSGEVDLNSPEGSARATEMALNLGVGGFAAAPMKPGLGIFGGRMSKDAVKQAEKMTEEGFHPTTIKEITGLERGAEGMWRKEISDVNAHFEPKNLKVDPIIGDKVGLLGDVLSHKDLYRTYPDAKYIQVSTVSKLDPTGRVQGQFNPSLDMIFLKEGMSPEETKSVLIHELQHWVQYKEGFHYGNVETLPKELVDRYKGYTIRQERPTLEKIVEMGKAGKREEADSLAQKLLSNADYKTYKALASETEARNAQARIGMDAKRISRSLGVDTEDVPRSEQIIQRGSNIRVGTE